MIPKPDTRFQPGIMYTDSEPALFCDSGEHVEIRERAMLFVKTSEKGNEICLLAIGSAIHRIVLFQTFAGVRDCNTRCASSKRARSTTGSNAFGVTQRTRQFRRPSLTLIGFGLPSHVRRL